MSIFTNWKKRREQRKKVKELSTFAHCFGSLTKLEQSGMLAWEQKQRRLFIEQPFALLMMRNAQSWQNFIQNCYLWTYYRESQKAWDDYMRKEELAAVREASKKYAALTRADIERIRRARRQEIQQSDMKPPKVEGFEFFIVTPPELSKAESGELFDLKVQSEQARGKVESSSPVGTLLAVGHYDPETEQMEMELWSRVQSMLQTTHKNDNK